MGMMKGNAEWRGDFLITAMVGLGEGQQVLDR